MIEISNKKKVIWSFLTFIFMIWFAKSGSRVRNGNDIGTLETLKTSSFARIMFMDIGVLSTIFSLWIFSTKTKHKNIFGILVMFLGSFALLPFLIIHFLTNKKD